MIKVENYEELVRFTITKNGRRADLNIISYCYNFIECNGGGF
jgi:hypothetical protein